jgi:hypothetical protein
MSTASGASEVPAPKAKTTHVGAHATAPTGDDQTGAPVAARQHQVALHRILVHVLAEPAGTPGTPTSSASR